MKFRFKTQQYQVDAVNAVVDVFKGQPFIVGEEYTRDLGEKKYKSGEQMTLFDIDSEGQVVTEDDDIGFSNAAIRVSESKLLDNIREIQAKANLHESHQLDKSLGAVSLDVDPLRSS